MYTCWYEFTTDSALCNLHALTRLTAFMQNTNPVLRPGEAHPCIGVITGIWSVLSDVARRHPNSEGRLLQLPHTYSAAIFTMFLWFALCSMHAALAEKLSRCYKHTMRSAGADQFKPLLQPLAQQLTVNFAAALHSPYLYCASICVTQYGRYEGGAMWHVLIKLLQDLSMTASPVLSRGLEQVCSERFKNMIYVVHAD